MLEYIRENKKRKQMILVYTDTLASFQVNRNRLVSMIMISETMGAFTQSTKDKMQEALRQCDNCIYRLTAIIKRLKDHDCDYINEQARYITEITNEFATISLEINDEIQEYIRQKGVTCDKQATRIVAWE